MKNKFSRYWHLLHVAIRLIRLRFIRRESDHLHAKKAIASQLGDMGGIAMKVGQVFADVGNASELRSLLDREAARPLSEMLPVLEQELGSPVSNMFGSLRESTSAASLGQVHQATLISGEKVAVKIQYPFIADAVQAELKLAGLIPGLGPVKRWGINMDAYRQTLAGNMQRELDYRSEAERQQYLAKHLKVDGLVIPKIFPEYSTPRILVQSWENGQLLDQIIDWPKPDRMLIGRTLLITLFQSIFKVGEVHGDPHMGNSFYRHAKSGRPEVVLLDYGCTIHIEKNARLALLKLIIETRENRQENILGIFSAMNFDPHKLAYIARELPLLAQILFKPFLGDEPFNAEKWVIKASFEQLLGDNKWWFRSAGPSELFLLMRTFQGTIRQLERLQVSLPWWPLLEQSIGQGIIEEARAYTPPALPDDLPVEEPGLDRIATSLHINVAKQDETIVDMTLPAQAALDLEDIMPDEIQQRISSSLKYDFKELSQTLLDSGFMPRDILSLESEGKSYHVWLE